MAHKGGVSNRKVGMLVELATILGANTEWFGKLDWLIKTYQDLYRLGVVQNRESISPSFFSYCLRGRYFVVVALYNRDRNFFIQRDFIKGTDYWELVGGWVKPGETFESALDRIVLKETGNNLIEAVPMALVENYFFVDNGAEKEIRHTGIAFLGRLNRDEVVSQNGVFDGSPEYRLNSRDAKILDLAKKFLIHKAVEPPIEEVDSYKALHPIAKWIHCAIIKKVSYYGSSRILQRIVYKSAHAFGRNNERTVLDVACGDDNIVITLAEDSRLVVANDISRGTMSKLIKHSEKYPIVFTNQNLLELQFPLIFDVVICKNTLHHMRNLEEINLLLSSLKRLGKHIVLMDVENPALGLISWLWNLYYRIVLRDCGGFFINFNQFSSAIKLFYGDAKKVSLKRIRTVKGYYMLAIIDQ